MGSWMINQLEFRGLCRQEKFVSRWDVMKKKADDRWIFKVFWTKVRLENQLTSLIWFVAFKSINWHYIKLGLALPILNSNLVWKGNALCRLESELFWTAFILVPYYIVVLSLVFQTPNVEKVSNERYKCHISSGSHPHPTFWGSSSSWKCTAISLWLLLSP